jgi:hypothetical protein
MNERLLNLEVMPFLPDLFKKGEPVPADLIGAKIVAFGSAPRGAGIEGGGLIVDYVPLGTEDISRVVFSFTEVGMWTELIGRH